MRLERGTARDARHACKCFHYSRSMPTASHIYNVFNDGGEWCGCIIYSPGANNHIGSEYGLVQGQVLELVRVALNGRQGHGRTSQAVSASLRMLHADAPLCKLVISYADAGQGHYGTIYQATNWLYVGERAGQGYVEVNGERLHKKAATSRYGTCNIDEIRHQAGEGVRWVESAGKRKYLYFFDKRLRKKFQHLSQPYPKRETSTLPA